AKWYGSGPGAPKPVPLCRNKAAAQIMLNELVKKAELAKVGIVDPFEAHRKRPLFCPRCRGQGKTDDGETCECPGGSHLADFEAALLAKGVTPRQAEAVTSRARRVLTGCGFVFMGDLSASRTMEYLAALRESGRAMPPLNPD